MQKIWSCNFFPLHRKEANSASASFVFFNGADISICLMLWVASALLLIGIYLRFVSGKRCLTLLQPSSDISDTSFNCKPCANVEKPFSRAMPIPLTHVNPPFLQVLPFFTHFPAQKKNRAIHASAAKVTPASQSSNE